MNRIFRSTWVFALILVVSCQLFESKPKARAIAKVHDTYLYEDELKEFNIPSGLSEKDSISLLTEYIDKWASEQLLLYKAQENMTEANQEKYDKLVEAYKTDLFISAYKNAFVQKTLNTAISEKEINDYYSKNKESFSLQEDLIQVRYIQMAKNYNDLSATRRLFTRFKEEDKEELNKIKLSFIKVDLNEEQKWISYPTLVEELPGLKAYKQNKIVEKGKFVQFKDNEGKYLIEFDDVIRAGNPAPIAYVENQIKQILLNKRKLKLKSKLEKEIIKDASETKEYIIFE